MQWSVAEIIIAIIVLIGICAAIINYIDTHMARKRHDSQASGKRMNDK